MPFDFGSNSQSSSEYDEPSFYDNLESDFMKLCEEERIRNDANRRTITEDKQSGIVIHAPQEDNQKRINNWHFGHDKEFRERNEVPQESILEILYPETASSHQKYASEWTNGSSKQANRLAYCNYPPRGSPLWPHRRQEQWKSQSRPDDYLRRLSLHSIGSAYNMGINTPTSSRFGPDSPSVSQMVRRHPGYFAGSASSFNSFCSTSPYTYRSPSSGYFNKEVTTPVSSRNVRHNHFAHQYQPKCNGYSADSYSQNKCCPSAIKGDHFHIPRCAPYRIPVNQYPMGKETKLAGYSMDAVSKSPVASFGNSALSRNATNYSIGSPYDPTTLKELLNRPVNVPPL